MPAIVGQQNELRLVGAERHRLHESGLECDSSAAADVVDRIAVDRESPDVSLGAHPADDEIASGPQIGNSYEDSPNVKGDCALPSRATRQRL